MIKEIEYINYRNPISISSNSKRKENAIKLLFRAAENNASPIDPGESIGDSITIIQDNSPQIITSLGKTEKVSTKAFRLAGSAIARWLVSKETPYAEIELDSFENYSIDHALSALCEGLYLGGFRFTRHNHKNAPKTDTKINIISSTNEHPNINLDEIKTVIRGVNLSRSWAQEPANIINPKTLADRITILAKRNNLSVKIIEHKELEEMNMGGLLSVGKGSKTPPQMIIIHYPGIPKSDEKPIVLIGKAITFDTGGYSLKDTDHIQGMKYDKSGAAIVIGTIQAAAELELSAPIIGIIPAAENMISETAYRPDDIITTMSGKTVEIISTDAEGRLTLADAITYAQKQYQPKVIIDLATLTGGIITALGRNRCGLMSNNDVLAKDLIKAGKETDELLWQMPLDDEYALNIKSEDAEIKNSGGREASPIIGGIFLKQFVDDKLPWAHLDIAGVANTTKTTNYSYKGATGFGVRLLINYLQNQLD